MGDKFSVGPTTVEGYRSILVDKYRPPSKGGNTRAWHQHRFDVEGETYSFLALGTKRWIFARDTVEFEWSWDDSEKYRNVDTATVRTRDGKGNEIVRGDRGDKKWRSADTRLPASRREQRD